MTHARLVDLGHAAPVFCDRDALRSVLGELSGGWPAVVAIDGELKLLLPWDAVGYSENRRLVDLPLVRAVQVPGDADLETVLSTMGDADFVVVMEAAGALGVVSRCMIVEGVADSLRAEGSASPHVHDVVEQLPEGVVVLNAERAVLHVNVVGRDLIRLLADVGVGDTLRHLGGVAIGTLVEDARLGIPRDISSAASANRIYSVRSLRPNTTTSDMVLILRDVTHVRHRQLREATQERVLLLGHLAGSIAHDFNNVLTVIMGQASLLQATAGNSNRDEQAIQAIQDAGQRAGRMIRQLLAFSRRELAEPVVLDTRAMLTELESLLQRIVGSHVVIQLRISADLWPVNADPVQIERIVANLVVYARDAMPDGGTVTIEAENIEQCAHLPRSDRPIRAVRIRVRDTGRGMDTATLARVFEPYFTTRVGAGTGLGLATVHATVSSLGGRITVESQPGQGSVFDV